MYICMSVYKLKLMKSTSSRYANTFISIVAKDNVNNLSSLRFTRYSVLCDRLINNSDEQEQRTGLDMRQWDKIDTAHVSPLL